MTLGGSSNSSSGSGSIFGSQNSSNQMYNNLMQSTAQNLGTTNNAPANGNTMSLMQLWNSVMNGNGLSSSQNQQAQTATSNAIQNSTYGPQLQQGGFGANPTQVQPSAAFGQVTNV